MALAISDPFVRAERLVTAGSPEKLTAMEGNTVAMPRCLTRIISVRNLVELRAARGVASKASAKLLSLRSLMFEYEMLRQS
jgi:hypothetical protein